MRHSRALEYPGQEIERHCVDETTYLPKTIVRKEAMNFPSEHLFSLPIASLRCRF